MNEHSYAFSRCLTPLSPVLAARSTADSAAARLVTCGPRQKKAKTVEPKNSVSVGKGFNGKRKEPPWQCAQGCGACCKLEKGPSFPTPEDIFQDPSDVQLYRSLIGKDGWCIHYEKTTRTCSIYSERPYFCRVEPDVFQALYGVDEKRFNKEACSCCRDTIKAVYGARSKELDNFNHTIRNCSPS